MEPFHFAAGWYPDPTHRFEYRYYNGERWTADVARQSARYVDPIGAAGQPPAFAGGWGPAPPTFVAPPSRAMAVTALVFSLCAIAIAWMPFLFVVGAAGAIAALVLGIIVLRRSTRNARDGELLPIGQGMAVAAVCCAVAAMGLCVVGFQLTRIVLREVDQLVNPGPHEVQLDSCELVNGRAVAEGSIRNRDTEVHGYSITVEYRLDGERWEADTVRVTDVGPGETAAFETRGTALEFSPAELTCTIDQVYGPPPFSS